MGQTHTATATISHNPPAPAEGAPQGEQQGEGGGASDERPEYIPEKFWDAEKGSPRLQEMATSYAALETRLGAGGGVEGEADGNTQSGVGHLFTEEQMKAYGETVAATGALSEEQSKALADAGVPAEIVGAVADTIKSKGSSVDTTVHNVFGGKEGFDTAAAWLSGTDNKEAIDAYNEAVNSGSTAAAKLAAEKLMADWKKATSQPPAGRVNGSTVAPGNAGPKPYSSWDDALAVINNPKYQESEEFRQAHYARLDISNF